MYSSSFYECPGEGPAKLLIRGLFNFGSEQLQILGNNLAQQLKLGWSCQLHGEKGLEGTTFHNADTQNGEWLYQKLSLHDTSTSGSSMRGCVLGSVQGGHIHALDRVQKKAAKSAQLTNESNWETLSQRGKILCICAVFKAYSGERRGRL